MPARRYWVCSPWMIDDLRVVGDVGAIPFRRVFKLAIIETGWLQLEVFSKVAMDSQFR